MSEIPDLSELSKGLGGVLTPRSVAVVGASQKGTSLGREILHNLIQFGFQGPVYPVHPKAAHVHSLRAWPSVDAIPDPVDLAVVVVPARYVLDVVKACARKGVQGMIIVTAGFQEVGAKGAELQAEIIELVRKHDIRLVGPNCMGVINTNPEVSLDASFGATIPLVGSAGFASQSGALGEVVLATAKALGLGISQFVSLGNKADVSGNDLLAWWATDPQTQVILLYLENFGNPHKFVKIARQVTRRYGKPILAVKSGRTVQGAAAAQSHTGSLASGDQAVGSLLAHCGVVRCNTVGQLFDMAMGFCNQPLPPGGRVAILSNAGGPGIMATDAAVFFGLDIACFTPETLSAMKAALPVEASTANPVDMIASATPEQYEACAEVLIADPSVDALLVIFVSPVITDPPAIAQGIVSGVKRGMKAAGVDKPVLACFMGREKDDRGIGVLREAQIPNYSFPESAVQTLAAMARFQQWRTEKAGSTVHFEVDHSTARQIIDKAQRRGSTWLSSREALALIEAYGISSVPSAEVHNPDEAIQFAEQLGYPVVLKLDSAEVIHKSDQGAVQLNLRSAGEIKGAFWDIQEVCTEVGVKDPSYLVQKMVTGGTETIIGAVQDPMVGHLLMFGLGGVYVELMEDVVFRVHPLHDIDTKRMIREVRGFPLLEGYRGSAPVDLPKLEEALLRVSQLVGDFPEIAELDLNPFMAQPADRTSVCVDARVRLKLQ
ncbi:MAG: CoA-binding protein [Proteobacteria bacterium]|jgi:acetate---CoA ligase (ADP-forming)|nr:CoA-binding protein [Pseudomonadota bacterium]